MAISTVGPDVANMMGKVKMFVLMGLFLSFHLIISPKRDIKQVPNLIQSSLLNSDN